jgi:SSS family solute:Na+ symporter
VPVSAVFFFIGTGLFAYYHVHPQDLQEVETVVAARKTRSEGIRPSTADYDEKFKKTRAGLSVKEVGDNVFPHFIGARLPVGVTGLLIAAIFAAAMSTVSTSLNSSATLLMSDYYKRYINKDATEKQAMRVLYGATIVWGALGTGMALLLVRLTESALDAWWTMSGIFGGGMLGLFLLGMISRKARNPAAVTGVLAGLALIGWMTLSSRWTGSLAFLRSPFHAFMIPVFGTLAILLIGLLASRFGKGTS